LRRSIKSLNIETISDVTLTEKSDRSGTITLGPSHPWQGWLGEPTGQAQGITRHPPST
jgi:hypothetical protein